ncbi:hypothetical protein D3C81_1667610 [compost metagenome]
MEGLVEAGADRADQADALGHRGQRRQQGEGLQVGSPRGACGDLGAAGALQVDRHAVGDEQRIELGGFGQLGDPQVCLEVHLGAGRHVRVTPGGDVMTGGHQEGIQAELSLAHEGFPVHRGIRLAARGGTDRVSAASVPIRQGRPNRRINPDDRRQLWCFAQRQPPSAGFPPAPRAVLSPPEKTKKEYTNQI